MVPENPKKYNKTLGLFYLHPYLETKKSVERQPGGTTLP